MRALLALLLLAPADEPANHPSRCPYTEGDAEELAEIGVVSIGGFEFGMEDSTSALDAFLETDEVIWVETAHFKLGFGLGKYKVPVEEREGIRAELAAFEEAWPKEVDEKARVLDPWIRAYMYGRRLEAFYAEFQALVRVTDDDFPEAGKIWDTTGKYMGQGRFLGEIGKYEVLILPSGKDTQRYLRKYFGLRNDLTQRWNMLDKTTLQVVIPAEDHLRIDRALHGHVVFNVTQLLINGYRHYSYDVPIWLREGMAHYYERRISPSFNTFDSSEGAEAQVIRKDDWKPEVRKLVQREEAISLARLMALRDFAGLARDDHLVTWSIIDYLMTEHPGFVGVLIDRCAGLLNDKFIPDGSGVDEEHRAVFKEELKMSYGHFDRTWRAWVLEAYPAR